MWVLCCAYPETLVRYHLLSFNPAREGGIAPCAIWPKRKRPEYTNKGTGLLQAELKLVYYTAPFEINVGGEWQGQALRVFSSGSLMFLPFVV